MVDLSAAPSKAMHLTAWAVVVLVALLSFQPAVNMLSPHQVMNTSFDPLDLVNTYGAFGTVGRERLNVVFEGTNAAVSDESADWKPYPYNGLPVWLPPLSADDPRLIERFQRTGWLP